MADRFDKFTDNARRALTLAQEEALRFQHDYIGTEHLLLGLIRETDSTAGRVLQYLGVDVARARGATEFIIGRGDRSVMGEIGLTPGSKRVIELAVVEARTLDHRYVGTEHLLLGLIREGQGVGAGVLESLGVTLDSARACVLAALSEGTAEGVTSTTVGLIGNREPAEIIDGKAVAEAMRHEVADRARRLKEKRGITPGLALVLVGDNPSSLSYVRSKGDTAEQAGLYSDFFHFPETTEMERVVSHVQDLNVDPRFHGILVQLPLPRQMSEEAVIGVIEPAKDVDGVTATSLGRILRGEPAPWPATPNGIVELLHRTGHAPAGKHVVVCGRSNIVGKPIAAILMQKNEKANATVTVCHTGTTDLAHYTREADILIAAMGSPKIITADMVKPGVVVIDVGNNWIEDPTRKSGRRLVGDVDYEAVREVASAITPVPGGVGPMTIAMLLMNTVWLAERYGQSG